MSRSKGSLCTSLAFLTNGSCSSVLKCGSEIGSTAADSDSLKSSKRLIVIPAALKSGFSRHSQNETTLTKSSTELSQTFPHDLRQEAKAPINERLRIQQKALPAIQRSIPSISGPLLSASFFVADYSSHSEDGRCPPTCRNLGGSPALMKPPALFVPRACRVS